MTGRKRQSSNLEVVGSTPTGPTLMMNMHKEYNYCFIGIIIILLVYILFVFTNDVKLQIVSSIFAIILGSSLVILGFWGADFAFALASGHLDQSREKGKFRGQNKKVYVPFMRNYTPLEWWNLNWFITFMGVFLIVVGTLVLGIIFGVYVF
jgi:hypothetical protein